jgi:hypothetical protein
MDAMEGEDGIMIGIHGRKKLVLNALHNKREARHRVAAKQAHLHLLALNEYAMEMMELGADARSTQERGDKHKHRMN